jgi:outer membrane protein assembly factor BamB
MVRVIMKNNRFWSVLGLAGAVVWIAACGSPVLKPADFSDLKFPLINPIILAGWGPMIPPIVPGPGKLILLASKTGSLQAFDPANSEAKSFIWKYSVKKADTAPVVSDGRIIWADSGGRIFRLDEKGKVVWTKNLSEPVIGEMRVVGTEVVFRQGEKSLSALDPEKGDILWRTSHGAIGDWTTDETRIVIRTMDNHIKVVHPNGRLFLDIPMAEAAVGSFGLDKNFVFIGLAEGRCGCYNLATGKKRWSIRLGAEPIGRPVSDGKHVYVVLSGQILAALDARRGDLLWWSPLSGRGAYTPRIVGDFVFVSSLSDKLQAFSRKTGKSEIAYTATREIVASVELVGTMLNVVSNALTEDRLYFMNFNLAPPAPAEAVPVK